MDTRSNSGKLCFRRFRAAIPWLAEAGQLCFWTGVPEWRERRRGFARRLVGCSPNSLEDLAPTNAVGCTLFDDIHYAFLQRVDPWIM
jgi:hypothetical protein